MRDKLNLRPWLPWLVALLAIGIAATGKCAAASDPVLDQFLDLFIKKGFVTPEEVEKVKAEAEAMRTNSPTALPESSKWQISKAIKNVELFGDLRLRYEDRSAADPQGGSIELQRIRYAFRVGLRGEIFDDYYYGFRLETAANPRSPWVTMGTSASGTPYQGPFGKSTAGINLGQIYLGWKPTAWFDVTLGNISNPLYTTTMVWDGGVHPEGVAEH